MSASFAAPFSLSCALHAAIIAALIWWLGSPAREITPPVLTLEPSLAALPRGDAAGAEGTRVTLTLPSSPPRAPATRDLNPTEAQRESPRPAAPAPRPAARPAPAMPPKPVAAPTGPKMTYEDFRRQHGQATASPRPATVPVAPRVSESVEFPRSSESTASAPTSPTGAGSTETLFAARLLRDLRAAFIAPPHLRPQLSVRVRFVFDADGRMTRVEVERTSGDRDFDAATLAAFKSVRVQGFTPREVGKSFTVEFQATER